MHCNTSLFAAAALPVLQAAIRASIVALFAAESWEYPSRLAIRAVVPFVWEKEVEKTYDQEGKHRSAGERNEDRINHKQPHSNFSKRMCTRFCACESALLAIPSVRIRRWTVQILYIYLTFLLFFVSLTFKSEARCVVPFVKGATRVGHFHAYPCNVLLDLLPA